MKKPARNFKPRPPEDYLEDPDGSRARGLYKRTSNPLFAWPVLAACIERDHPLPPEIKQYFLTVCRDILRIADADMPPKARREAISHCIIPAGRGGNNKFTQFRKTRRNEAIVHAVDDLKSRDGYASGAQTLEKVYGEVAAMNDRQNSLTFKGIEPDTVKKAYQRNRYEDWAAEVIGPRRPRTRKKKGRERGTAKLARR